jgi:hypothetical protein
VVAGDVARIVRQNGRRAAHGHLHPLGSPSISMGKADARVDQRVVRLPDLVRDAVRAHWIARSSGADEPTPVRARHHIGRDGLDPIGLIREREDQRPLGSMNAPPML